MMWDNPLYYLLSPSGLLDLQQQEEPQTLWRGIYVPRLQQPPRHSGMSQVSNNDNEFRMMVDVSHFKPDEINVKTVDRNVIITGKHEERQDEHGFIQRQFSRKYLLPEDVDPNTITSSLSDEGVLTVKAPKLAIEGSKERTIPVQYEAAPAITQNSKSKGGK